MDISMRGAAPRPIRILLIIWLMISVVSLAQAALPITLEGERVGGIGVGGAPGAHLDEACARQGLRAIGVEE